MRIPPLRTAALSPAALRAHLSAPAPAPLKLTGLVEHWPARAWAGAGGSGGDRGGLAGLRAAVGEERVVEVELGRRGRGYLDAEWRRVGMPFGLFLDAFVLQTIPRAGRGARDEQDKQDKQDAEDAEDKQDAGGVKGAEAARGDETTAYLAQAELDDYPALGPLVPALAHCAAGPRGDVYRRTLWVGPASSFTPFHRDPYIGIYTQGACARARSTLKRPAQEYRPGPEYRPAQEYWPAQVSSGAPPAHAPVVGEKTFHLLPPAAAAHLAPSPHPLHRNTSTIPVPVSRLLADTGADAGADADGPGAETGTGAESDAHAAHRAALAAAFSLPGAGAATLAPGESVLVPEGWWHAAEGGASPGVGFGTWFR